MDKMAKGGDDMILLIGGELTNGKREFSVPVDSTVQSIGVSVFLQCAKSITIVDSAGAQVAAGPQVEDATFHAGRLLQMTSPPAGSWRIRNEGAESTRSPFAPKATFSSQKRNLPKAGVRRSPVCHKH